jgi:putative oxidoreductase
MNYLIKSITVNPAIWPVSVGQLLLRVSTGLMIFYVHGLHKLEGGIAYVRNGTAWPLMADVVGMHFPAPVASAWAATIVQFMCSLFIVVGLFTRINALLLTGALSGAIMQNLMARRDPQLAILYTFIVVTIIFMGGGRFSLDAVLNKRSGQIGRGTA